MGLGDASVGERMGGMVRPPKARTPEQRAAAAAQNRVEQAQIILANEEAALAERQKRVDAARAELEQARAALPAAAEDRG